MFNCGPLWETSTFMFEGYNRTLGKLFQGTQKVPLQISQTFLMAKNMTVLAGRCIDENSHSGVSRLYGSFSRGHVDSRQGVAMSDGLKVVGKGSSVHLLPSKVVLIQNLIQAKVDLVAVSYARFVYNHQLFCSVNYIRSVRHCNSYVKIEHDEYSFGRIDMLLIVKLECSCLSNVGCPCKGEYVVLVEPGCCWAIQF